MKPYQQFDRLTDKQELIYKYSDLLLLEEWVAIFWYQIWYDINIIISHYTYILQYS